MRERRIQLQYRFGAEGQPGDALQHPLFELLAAVDEGGSIQHAARSLGVSYRHTWGQLKHWEARLGQPLLVWTQGQPARLTPFARRLRAAEARSRARLAPHIEALRAGLEDALAEALDGTLAVSPTMPTKTGVA